ncbi:MAG TPA: sortase, partial [Chloroflexota bacterium]|nr:sortase [Chloroflexota bacterium]
MLLAVGTAGSLALASLVLRPELRAMLTALPAAAPFVPASAPAPPTSASPYLPASTLGAYVDFAAAVVDRTEGANAADVADALTEPAARQSASSVDSQAPAGLSLPPPQGGQITRLWVPAIALDVAVVQAKLVEVPGGSTWEVPAFTAGHGEYSGRAGQPGNAVLLGHVTSPRAGSVFKDLHRLRAGEALHIEDETRAHTYRVVEVRTVDRTDVSV